MRLNNPDPNKRLRIEIIDIIDDKWG